VTAGRDEHLAVWDARDGTPIATVDARAGPVRQLAIAPDGRTAYAAGEDGSVTAWDISGDRRLGRPFPAAPGTRTNVAPLTPDGATFAVAGAPAVVDLLDSGTLARTGRVVVGGSAASAHPGLLLATSRDGRTMAVGTAEGAVQFVDLATDRPRGPPTFAHVGAVTALAFTPEGRWLATSGRDNAIYLWDVARQRPARLYARITGPATSLSVSPDGTRLAATILRSDGTGEIVLFRIPRLAVVARVPRAGTQIQFSRSGRSLLFDDDTGVVRTVDARTLAPRGAPLGAPSGLGRFALSPDGDTVAVTAGDGTTQLWDLSSRSRIGGALPGVAGTDVRTAFVDGGNRLVTVGGSGPGQVWDVRPQSWARRACRIAGRPLTRAEWHEALPQRAYDPACRPR
jgi:WD40 repeat protein